MKINWFTVIAQVINFLVLVWLLKRFLYKPILKATDQREKSIVSRLEDASSKKAEAKKERDEFQKKNEQFEQEKRQMMQKAVAETKAQNDQMMQEARNVAAAYREKQQKNLRQMESDLKNELAQRTSHEVLDISRKVLADLASEELEAQIVRHFTELLAGMDENGKQQFSAAYQNSSGPIVVRSAFELRPEQQTGIKNTIDQLLNKSNEYRFETDGSLSGGIEMAANGYRLTWNIASYLEALEEKITEALKEKSEQEMQEPREQSSEDKAEAQQEEHGSEGPE